jgi:lipopolysaccharide transport system ATP-binding protein
MSDVVIKVENLGKQYRLGQVGTGTLSQDLNRWWYKVRGKNDPYLKVGDVNDRSVKAESDYVWALQDINFEVKRGEVLGIIGRNGAGKSTLLKILSRVTGPTVGDVKIKGRIASLLEVGTGFNPDLTGRENIFLNGAILGMTKEEIRKKFDEIVDFSGVERYIDTPVKRYSSGMYVRLAFAVAAHLDPEILILDEVLAVGDAEFQKKCLGRMKDASEKEGRTVLFVSHNMQAVSAICQRGIILQHGRIHTNDEIGVCMTNYFNMTKQFNFNNGSSLKDRLSRANGKVRFTKVIGINHADGGETWTFSYNESIRFRIVCEVMEACVGLVFYMAVKGILHQDVITNIKQLITNKHLSVGEKVSFEVILDKNTIRSGQYDLYFWIGDPANLMSSYDVIDGNVNLPSLIIMPSSLDVHENSAYVTIPFSIAEYSE